MYNDDTKVIHLGDVANTGSNLVAFARSQGRNWALREIPGAPSMKDPRAWIARGRDAFAYAFHTGKPDLAHIHYGPNGYYGSLKRAPFVLHLHGTDLRQDLHRPLLGDLERYALGRAEKVIVATPDLLDAAQEIRSDAVYVPNPVPQAAVSAQANNTGPVPGRVVFSARWDDSKGGLRMVKAASDLVKSGADVVGVNWGTYAEDARRAGVHLVERMPPEGFRELLASGQVVVGQHSMGSLGISELEAMLIGRPLVTNADAEHGSTPAVRHVSGQSIPDSVLALLEHPQEAEALGLSGQKWVLEHRNPEKTLLALEEIYSGILD